ncbi:hypothetical protein [Ornithinimicrobium cerasi]|uniref:Uncharacterized protein n=1 Tax=Ornithinimicrobium cerasi TaxID=2248773 RepID=A0A285VS18_9MICO|nr:hypothetical protein [Ornithinimicrobium cerasi]SOC56842.1 hypothetical protein SAMN05421879_10951 [Ornithinimicrobium cerasi]
MAPSPRLKDRLFTLLCTGAAAAVLLAGASRGNLRVGVVGACFFLGYGVLHSVTRRLTPAARLLTGDEADVAERLAQFRATRAAGQAALGLALGGILLDLAVGWEPGLWVAGACLVVVATFVAALWFFSRPGARRA